MSRYDNRKDLLNMVRNYLDGKATPEELAFLEKYYHFFDAEENITAQMQAEEKRLLEQEMEAGIWSLVDERPKAKVLQLWTRIAAAASLIILLTIAGYFAIRKSPVDQQSAKIEILPGGNKAYLTLSNGKRISLTDAGNGTIANQAGNNIRKTANGKLAYDISHNNHNVGEIVYNTIETPRGGQYQLQLPDGSKVWLNAASSLKYPAAFAGANREVNLTGEAYFEVAKDKSHPFIVKTEKEEVKVLGTHFNINSYSDEPDTKTTLLEGSVQMNKNTILKPGQQAILNDKGIKLVDADEEETLAWKKGLFVFNDEPLESIMRKISRWYDVDIQYGDVDKTQSFFGGISRFTEVSKVLRKLESTNTVHFKIEGRVIYVSK